ncbi:molybdopterin molybdotransferase MoeA [Isosphaeraceae bacterium EP7]
MLTDKEATLAVLAAAEPLPAHLVSLGDAGGLILAENVSADLDSPPFTKALVDGYAVRSSDLGAAGSSLPLGRQILAGQSPDTPLGPREAASIMTGAPMPEGADAVVMIERTVLAGDLVEFLDDAPRPGRNLMPRGREMRAGDLVARLGDVLSPALIGLLAAVGRPRIAAFGPARVAVVPTGDELVEADFQPGPGQIRNSNGPMLAALAREAGALATLYPIAPDDEGPLTLALKEGLDADVLLIIGGVSAGVRDLVPHALGLLGVETVFHKVRIKPGKPLLLGLGPNRSERPRCLVFGLPGNPASGFVNFHVFVAPALDKMTHRQDRTRWARLRLSTDFAHRGDRPTYHPSRYEFRDGSIAIRPLDWAGSADLRSLTDSDALIRFAEGDRHYRAGEEVDILQTRGRSPDLPQP